MTLAVANRPAAADQNRLGPVLLVPGYGGSTDSLRSLAARLVAAGRDATIVSLPGDGTGDLVAAADALGDQALAALDRTGAASVDVVGYSAGGVTARLWVADGGAALARRIITLGSPNHGTTVADLANSVLPDPLPLADELRRRRPRRDRPQPRRRRGRLDAEHARHPRLRPALAHRGRHRRRTLARRRGRNHALPRARRRHPDGARSPRPRLLPARASVRSAGSTTSTTRTPNPTRAATTRTPRASRGPTTTRARTATTSRCSRRTGARAAADDEDAAADASSGSPHIPTKVRCPRRRTIRAARVDRMRAEHRHRAAVQPRRLPRRRDDARRTAVGSRVACSTFHHFADMNWDTDAGAPSFVTERPATRSSATRHGSRSSRTTCTTSHAGSRRNG